METRGGRATPRAGATILAAACALAGCGAPPGHPDHPATPCEPDRQDTFVLDWTGGRNILHNWEELPPLDLSRFAVEGGGTLADAGDFRGMVRDEVEAILRDAGIDGDVVEGEQRPGVNVVHISSAGLAGRKTVGLGSYDPCNCRHADFSVVYTGRWLELGRSAPLAGWVNAFAGVAAHEIGHNVGLDHVEDESGEGVELMSAKKTWSERQVEHRVLTEQDNCRGGAADSEPSVVE